MVWGGGQSRVSWCRVLAGHACALPPGCALMDSSASCTAAALDDLPRSLDTKAVTQQPLLELPTLSTMPPPPPLPAPSRYDHVGGGFHRYSVDELWHVPHVSSAHA